MSGYLLRMAASLRNPRGSIHPMPASLFSPAPFGKDAEDAPGQDALPTPARQISVFAPRPDVAAVHPESVTPGPQVRMDREEPADPASSHVTSHVSGFPSGAGSEHASEKANAEPARVERNSFQPLMSAMRRGEAETRSVAPMSAMSEAGEFGPPSPLDKSDATHLSTATWAPVKRRQSTNADEVSEETEPLETPLRGTGQRNVRDAAYRDRYQPLIAEMPRSEEKSAKPFTAGVRKMEKRDFSGREVRPEPQPDEIQIHIGRIEVVAVPPAPVRAETRPANKSLNLGDYLKLRHGRS